VDWRGDGWLSIDSLALVVAILLKLPDAAAAGRFLLTSFKVQKDTVVSYSEFTKDILPSLKKKCREDLSHQGAANTATSESWNDGVNAKQGAGLCRQLEETHASGNPGELADAARSLADIASVGDIRVIDVAGKLLQSSHVRVQQAGAALLVKVAGRSNDRALDVVSVNLQHHSARVRIASLEMLPRMAEKGDTKLTQKIWESQVDADDSVRLVALKTLTLLADRGDEYVIERLQEQIKSYDDHTARSDDRATNQDQINSGLLCEGVILALGEVATKGDSKTVDLLLAKLGHNDFKVRRNAIVALGKVAKKGNKRVLDAVFSMMREGNPDILWGCVCALVHLAELGDSAAIKALAVQAKAQEIWLKGAAVHALGQLVLPDGGAGEKAVRAAMKDPNDQVRQKAEAAIKQISERELGTGGDTREKSRWHGGYFGKR